MRSLADDTCRLNILPNHRMAQIPLSSLMAARAYKSPEDEQYSDVFQLASSWRFLGEILQVGPLSDILGEHDIK